MLKIRKKNIRRDGKGVGGEITQFFWTHLPYFGFIKGLHRHQDTNFPTKTSNFILSVLGLYTVERFDRK